MSAFSQALPQRKLTLAPNLLKGPRGFLFAVLMFAGLLIGMSWWQGPGLIRDLQISANPAYPDAVKTIDGECSTRRGLTDCDARLVYSVNGQRYDNHVSMAFIDFHSGDYMVEVVISGDKPELATLSLGLDMLWNRLTVFGVFALVFIAGIAAMVYGALGAQRGNRQLQLPGRLTLVQVELTNVQEKGKTAFVTYAEKLEKGRSRRTANTEFAASEVPLMAALADGRVVGVAAKHEMGGLPVLLDSQMQRITDLSAAERQSLLDSLPRPSESQMDVATGNAPKKLHWKRGLATFFGIILLAVAAVGAYWVYYVTSSETQFDSIGMEINAMLPEPLNRWGCDQLQARFGDDRAPWGCVAADFTSWK